MGENETISLPNPFAQATQSSLLAESTDLEGLERELRNDQEKEPNFPSFYPIVYHSISAEIPRNFAFIIKFAYFSACFFTLYCVFQFLVILFSFTIKTELFAPWRDIVLGLCTLLILPALLFYAQYYPFYCAVRDERTQKTHLVLVQTYVVFILILILIGFPGTGTVGIWWTIIVKDTGSWFFSLLGSILCIWNIISIIFQFYLLISMRPMLENSGRIANPADY